MAEPNLYPSTNASWPLRETGILATSDPKSSFELEELASSVKGRPKVSCKLYFDDAIPGARANALAAIKQSFTDLVAWASPAVPS